MMCDIKKRSGFGKLVNYANNPKKAILIDLKDVRDDNNSTIAASMKGQADDKPGRKLEKPVYHISLNFSKEDAPKLSNELMVEIAGKFMEKMGIRNTQYIVCRHTDTEHPHMHIVANRVDNDGNTISDRNDIHRGIKICRDITKKYGFHMSEGKKNVKRNRLNGRDNAKYFIYDSLNKYISKNTAWKGLERRLDEDGIAMKFHFEEKEGFA
ncbi:MAG: relaxase/mobilization nuclease domain-containing protein [Muribaculaceae bacterium]|nr:relaxase/mobilization nuclease domain-containing protein [Muribaculaceae bacterium]